MPISKLEGLSGSSGKGDTMSAKEAVEIISHSSLWKILTIKERIEAAAYAIKIAGIDLQDQDVSELIGEVYAG